MYKFKLFYLMTIASSLLLLSTTSSAQTNISSTKTMPKLNDIVCYTAKGTIPKGFSGTATCAINVGGLIFKDKKVSFNQGVFYAGTNTYTLRPENVTNTNDDHNVLTYAANKGFTLTYDERFLKQPLFKKTTAAKIVYMENLNVLENNLVKVSAQLNKLPNGKIYSGIDNSFVSYVGPNDAEEVEITITPKGYSFDKGYGLVADPTLTVIIRNGQITYVESFMMNTDPTQATQLALGLDDNKLSQDYWYSIEYPDYNIATPDDSNTSVLVNTINTNMSTIAMAYKLLTNKDLKQTNTLFKMQPAKEVAPLSETQLNQIATRLLSTYRTNNKQTKSFLETNAFLTNLSKPAPIGCYNLIAPGKNEGDVWLKKTAHSNITSFCNNGKGWYALNDEFIFNSSNINLRLYQILSSNKTQHAQQLIDDLKLVHFYGMRTITLNNVDVSFSDTGKLSSFIIKIGDGEFMKTISDELWFKPINTTKYVRVSVTDTDGVLTIGKDYSYVYDRTKKLAVDTADIDLFENNVSQLMTVLKNVTTLRNTADTYRPLFGFNSKY